MESMECDSDGDGDRRGHPQSISPMQHSGLYMFDKVLPSYTNQNQNRNSLDDVSNSLSAFRSPDTRWTSCRNVYMAVSSFSGFRTTRKTLSPGDGDRSLEKLSASEEEEEEDEGSLDRRGSSIYPFLFGSLPSSTATNPQASTPSTTSTDSSLRAFSVDASLGKTGRSHRYSLPVDSPHQGNTKCLSIHPDSVIYARSRSIATSNCVTQEVSGNSLADIPRSSKARSLCRPKSSKIRKREPGLSHTQGDSHTKHSLLTFKSFLVMSLLVGVCLSVYALKMFSPVCGDIRDFDMKRLEKELYTNVYGQHLAVETIPRLLDEYFSKVRREQDSKALVISLHGWTGVGKNFVSRIVSNFIPFSSVTTFIVPLHFPHEAQSDDYAEQIPEWTVTNITESCVNFVIFDEMDKAGDGVIRGLDKTMNILLARNFTATPVIFLFLSNSRGADINRFVFQKMSTGHSRESLLRDDLAQVFEKGVDLWYKKLDSVIDAFVPFLPLERKHVVQCIKKDMISKGLEVDTVSVKKVIKEMSFFKTNSDKEFSLTGCKRVSDKVNLVRHFHE